MRDEPPRTGERPVGTAAADFLAQRRIAVTGVSRSAGAHSANTIYRRLRDRGYEVSAINPNAEVVEGDRCFADLASVTDGIDAVVIATSADRADDTIRECIELGIHHVWLHHGPAASSVSPTAVALGREHGLQVIDGGCPLMFRPVSDLSHRWMRPVLTLAGRVPRRV